MSSKVKFPKLNLKFFCEDYLMSRILFGGAHGPRGFENICLFAHLVLAISREKMAFRDLLSLQHIH